MDNNNKSWWQKYIFYTLIALVLILFLLRRVFLRMF